MSRSLRSRPLTLYQARNSVATPQPVIPAIDEDHGASGSHDAPSGQRRRSGLGGGANAMRKTAGKRTGLSKASEVGSNLKKRLSMRYAQPTEVDSGGFSAIPEVPSLPTVLPGAPDLPPDSRGGYDANGRPLPIMGEGFGDIDAQQDVMGGIEDALEGSSHHSHGRPGSLQGRTSLDGRAMARRLSLEGFATDPAIDLDMLSQENFDPEMCE